MTITSGARWSTRRCHNAMPSSASSVLLAVELAPGGIGGQGRAEIGVEGGVLLAATVAGAHAEQDVLEPDKPAHIGLIEKVAIEGGAVGRPGGGVEGAGVDARGGTEAREPVVDRKLVVGGVERDGDDLQRRGRVPGQVAEVENRDGGPDNARVRGLRVEAPSFIDQRFHLMSLPRHSRATRTRQSPASQAQPGHETCNGYLLSLGTRHQIRVFILTHNATVACHTHHVVRPSNASAILSSVNCVKLDWSAAVACPLRGSAAWR